MKKETWKTLIQILNSNAVGPDGAHRRRFLCGEEKKGGTPMGMPLFASGTVPCGHSVPGTV